MLNKIRIFVSSIILCLLFTSFVCGENQAPLSYENEAMGVKITGPVAWFLTPGDKVQQAVSKGIQDLTNLESVKEAISKVGILAMFSEYQFGSPLEYNPNIALITEPLPDGYINTVMDYANASVINVKTMFKDVKIISEPKEIKLNGKNGAHVVYEGTMVRGYLEVRIRSSVYIFLKDKIAYTLTCTDKADNFSKNADKFEAAVGTFTLK